MGQGRPGRMSAAASLATALATAAIAAVTAAGPAAAVASAEPNRYSIAGGCFALRSVANGLHVTRSGSGYAASAPAVGGAERFRMKATDLGRYLFYGADETFMAVGALGSVSAAGQPSDGADWTVRADGSSFRIVNEFAGRELIVGGGGQVTTTGGAAGGAGLFRFVPASGCVRYPEVEINVDGAPATRSPLYGEVSGLLEAHMHMMAFEFLGGGAHCGRPWHRFGAPSALVDCIDHEPNGCAAVLENVLYGSPARCHDTTGWPTFNDWPDPNSLTHEQSYYRWVERAWRGGLRIFVNLLVENRVLCEVYPIKQNSCDEMDSLRLQARRIRELERYIDAQSGGPGRGWFRIVENPFHARRVINQGKLAVVLGMELSEPFGCGLFNEMPACGPEDVDAGIEEIHRLGVRQLELINKFDNALAGVAGDGGSTGVAVNAGNFYGTGRFWDLDHCDDPHNHDNSPESGGIHNDDLIIASGIQAFLPGGTLPVYPEPPNCNRKGLTALGERAIRRLMARGMIFDPDHMSVRARNEAMDVVESVGYPGVISSHSWSTDNALPRIYRLGGVITPYAGNSQSFVNQWRQIKEHHRRSSDQLFGVGYGADQNGFGAQGNPRGADVPNPVRYPFRSFDGSATIHRQRSGERVYDINVDGVAHYGLYPDWVEDLRMLAGDEIVRDLSRGAEAYLQTWERALGVEPRACRRWGGRVHRNGLGRRLRLGRIPRAVAFSAGQPQRRARAWRWCVRDGSARSGRGRVIGVFDGRERLGIVLSTVRAHRVAGIRRGTRRRALRGRARNLGRGLWVRRARGGGRFIFIVRRGRVRYVGVASRRVGRGKRNLRRNLRFAGLR